jgi:hypothetical protein
MGPPASPAEAQGNSTGIKQPPPVIANLVEGTPVGTENPRHPQSQGRPQDFERFTSWKLARYIPQHLSRGITSKYPREVSPPQPVLERDWLTELGSASQLLHGRREALVHEGAMCAWDRARESVPSSYCL